MTSVLTVTRDEHDLDHRGEHADIPTLDFMVSTIKTHPGVVQSIIKNHGKQFTEEDIWVLMSQNSIEVTPYAIEACVYPHLLLKIIPYLVSLSEYTAWTRNPYTPVEALNNLVLGAIEVHKNSDKTFLSNAFLTDDVFARTPVATLEKALMAENQVIVRLAVTAGKIAPELVALRLDNFSTQISIFMLEEAPKHYRTSCYEQYLILHDILDDTMIGVFASEILEKIYKETREVTTYGH